MAERNPTDDQTTGGPDDDRIRDVGIEEDFEDEDDLDDESDEEDEDDQEGAH